MQRRRTFDENGKPVVEVEQPDGTFEQEIDTARVRELKGDQLALDAEPVPTADDGGLSLEDTRPMARPHFAPYGDAQAPAGASTRRRSGLDYLRALSEQIKRRRRDEPES